MASPVSFGSPGSKSSYSPSSSFSSSSSSSSPFSMNENKVDVGNKRLGKRERRRQRDALTLEEQADEIHLRLHMPTRSPSSVTTTTTYSSSVSFASSPTRTKKRPSSAPYNSPHQKLLFEKKLALSVPSSSSTTSLVRPHTSTGGRPTVLSLAQFHSSLSEALSHIGNIGGRDKVAAIKSAWCQEDENASSPSSSSKQNSSQSKKSSSTWSEWSTTNDEDDNKRERSERIDNKRKRKEKESGTRGGSSRGSSTITHMLHQHGGRLSVASSIARERSQGALRIQRQWRHWRKMSMMQSCLTSMSRIVQEHMEESAVGCLQRVWRGAHRRRLLLEEYAPTLCTPTSRNSRNSSNNLSPSKLLDMSMMSNCGRRNKSDSTTFVYRASKESTAPWRSKPRFAKWRIQWWLSRTVPRWRFQRFRKKIIQIQQWYRCKRGIHREKEATSAVKLQNGWRGLKAREELKIRQMKQYHMCALFIQHAWWSCLRRCRLKSLFHDVNVMEMHLIERTRYERAMKEEDYLSLVNRDLVLDNMRDHVGIGGGCNITEMHARNYQIRWFRKLRERVGGELYFFFFYFPLFDHFTHLLIFLFFLFKFQPSELCF